MSQTTPDSESKALSREASIDKMKLDGTTSHVEQTQPVDFDDSIEDTEPSRAVWLITFTVAMGGFLFGKPLSSPGYKEVVNLQEANRFTN